MYATVGSGWIVPIPNRTTDSYLKRIVSTNCYKHTVVPPDDGHMLPALEDLFLLLLSILSWVFLFVSSLPVLESRSFWASYPPSFSPGDAANLSFAPLSILLSICNPVRLSPSREQYRH